MKSWREGNPAVMDWLQAILWGGILAPVGVAVALILLYHFAYYVGVLVVAVTGAPAHDDVQIVMLGILTLSVPALGTFAAKCIIDDHREW